MAYAKKDKKQFIKALQISPIVGDVCRKLDIARATYYRWRDSDPDFAAQSEEALRQSASSVSDLAESQLITAISEGDMRAITFWLTRRNENYLDPLKRRELELEYQRLQRAQKATERENENVLSESLRELRRAVDVAELQAKAQLAEEGAKTKTQTTN